MALYNVDSSGNYLISIGPNAHTESEIVNQDAGDTDFESIRETRIHWRLQNISTIFSSADTLITTTSLSVGDRIFIRLNNGTIIDTTTPNSAPAEGSVVPIMSSNSVPEGVAWSNRDGGNAWHAFDQNNGTGCRAAWNQSGGIVQYTFKDNTPVHINKFYVNCDGNGNNVALKIEGSVDGTNWSTIGEYPVRNLINGSTYNIESPGAFSAYRITNTNKTYFNVESFDLLGEGVSVDLSAYTNGETPDQVFKFKDTVAFNGQTASEKDIFYEYGSTGTKMSAISLYSDIPLTGRQLVTRVDFETVGNEVREITAQIYKAL